MESIQVFCGKGPKSIILAPVIPKPKTKSGNMLSGIDILHSGRAQSGLFEKDNFMIFKC